MSDATDDSLLRAIAAAPALQPPTRVLGVLVVRDGAALADRLRALAPRAEVDAADGVLRVVTADTPVALADVALALGRTCALVIDTAAGTPQPLIDRALALRGDGVVVDAATAQRLGARVRQRGSTWTMRPRRRRLVPVVAAIVLVAAVVAGLIELGQVALAPAGERLAQWTLDADGGPHEVVMLPSNLWDQLHLREASYVLRTDVVPEQRGQPLTLVVPCFHAPLALAVDGVAIVDIGDAIIGDHRFVIEGALTDRPRIELALSAHHDVQSSVGFGVAPTLAEGIADRPFVTALNRYTPLVALVLAGLFALLYGALAFFDRTRVEYRALAVGMIATMIVCLYLLGVLPFTGTGFGRLAPMIGGISGATMFLSILMFLHAAFELEPLSRFWVWAFATVAVFAIAGVFVWAAFVPYSVLLALIGPTTVVYVIVRCMRLARAVSHRYEARIILVWAIPQLASTLAENYWRWTGHNLVGGFHTIGFAITILVLAQTAVLGLQFITRQRTIERTADELRHQVAARSRELADALGKLADQPRTVLAPGHTIDARYRVIDKLGAGGMGTVYEVERVTDRTRCALKTLRDRVDVTMMARLAREAQLAAELRHPNLVPVLDVGIADGALYLVMELVVGGALERERGRFGDPKWATPILVHIATGLAAMHARGIVHRDLKPSNILLDRGVARIADFGLASLYVDHGDAHADTVAQSPMLTRAGDVFGTPAYMAPELALGAKAATPSADVFSFGVIACELLTGSSPFAEPPVLARAHGRVITTARLDVPPIVARCVDLDPAQRPTAAELVTALA